jgi:hypothetical protein
MAKTLRALILSSTTTTPSLVTQLNIRTTTIKNHCLMKVRKMMTQINMFEFIESVPIYPPVIQELISESEMIFSKVKSKFPRLIEIKHEYSIWDHVPNLGYRLFTSFRFDTPLINTLDKYCGIGAYEISVLFESERVTQKYKTKGIDVTFLYTPQSLYITTIETKKNKTKGKDEDYDTPY